MGNALQIAISCDEIISHCQRCICGKAAYIWELENNLDALRTSLRQLIAERDDVKAEVTIEEQRQRKRRNEVELWFSDVEALESEVNQLLEEGSQELEKLCLGGYCSKNFKSSYKFGKKVVRELDSLIALRERNFNQVAERVLKDRNFNQVAERVLEDLVDEIPIDQPEVMGQNQKSTFDEVWRCLSCEPEVKIIGIYGTGGVGKTTLLKQINNKLRHDHERGGFNVVIWVEVSKDLKLEKIQEDILKKISFRDDSWKDKNFEDRARNICNILSQKRFALLMDDVWEPVDFTKVGIPLQSSGISSKIIFTTRSLDICGQMEVQRKFEVSCLAHDEAWKLFQEKVGRDILDSHSGIFKLAETVVKECDGLPLALITVGRAMAYKKTLEEWIYAVQLLKKSVSKFPGLDKVYPRLKFSYDSLPDNNTRSCFLYCSLFPEDYKIHKSYLIDCWLGEGFLDESEVSARRYQGYSIIGILIRACLLEEEGDDYIKMHDVIRDMALWISCVNDKETENVLVEAGAGLVKAPAVEKWEGVRRISLMKNRMENLLETPICPQLLTLFLNFNHLKMISSDFFRFMPSLRVLNLSYNDYLTDLPSGISNLVSLQHLDLSGTAIKRLPHELMALVNLECLNLENTLYLHTIPFGMMCNFRKLRVLRMFGCSCLTESGSTDAILIEKMLEELCRLENLNVLSITIGSDPTFKRFLSSPGLQNWTQSLSLQHLKDLEINVVSFAEMQCLDALHVWDCRCSELVYIDYGGNLKNIRESHGFHSLRKVDIDSCDKLVDLTWLILAPNLKYVRISYCSKVGEIASTEKVGKIGETIGDLNPFSKLEILQLQDLPNLNSIYPDALPFTHMRELRVVGCCDLKMLPFNFNSAEGRKIVITGAEGWWNELIWEDKATQHAFLPCFKSL